MKLEDLAPWIAIAFTLALSILVPLFTQIANNRHQRKMQREKIEYEEKQKKTKAYETFLLEVGSAVVCRSRETLERAGSCIFNIYVYAPKEWLSDLDTLANVIMEGETTRATTLMQKIARLISDELNKKESGECQKSKKYPRRNA